MRKIAFLEPAVWQSHQRALQHHQCSISACLKSVKGKLQCKRRAPFARAAVNWVDDDGKWGPKRICGYLNNWNPTITRMLRANNDMKLIMGGGGTTGTLIFYITNYTTKKQLRTTNTSALIARRVAFVKKEECKQRDFNKLNKRLIQSCSNTLGREREFSAPEIISYIMGWGDTYVSHHYVSIYLDVFTQALKKVYPHIDPRWRRARALLEGPNQAETELHSIVTMVNGSIELKDSLRDYQYRGDELAQFSLLEFLLNTYEGLTEDVIIDVPEISSDPKTKRGRPLNTRIGYKAGAKKPKKCRIVRSAGHETLPRFIGGWFARNDVEFKADMFYASMLMFLKPWEKLEELKLATETFKEAFDKFVENAPWQCHVFIANAQYYHDCSDAAKADQKAEQQTAALIELQGVTGLDAANTGLGLAIDEIYQENAQLEAIDELDIEQARMMKMEAREVFHGQKAVVEGYDCGFFKDHDNDIEYFPTARVMDRDELDTVNAWAEQLKAVTREENQPKERHTQTKATNEDLPSIEQASPAQQRKETEATILPVGGSPEDKNATTMDRPKYALLNEEQRRAHDIIEKTLKAHLAGEKPKQLRLLVLGQGGTGKSMLIGAITETFGCYGASHLLAKCATTGIAASDIGGVTLHSWASLPIQVSNSEDWLNKSSGTSKRRREKNITGTEFLITDEVSMLEKGLVFTLSEVVSEIRAKEEKGSPHDPFRSMNMIFFGDFHQFPPVSNPTGALYVDRPEKDKRRALLGREIFLQFDKVVILEQQIRVKDKIWTGILSRLRVGECSTRDLEEIEKLVLSNEKCDVPNFDEAPWDQAILVTPRHGVRVQWNIKALEKHCMKSGNRRYIVPAEDICNKTGEALSMEARLAVAAADDIKNGKLPDVIHMAVGMKAMVLLNLATEADIANGTRGIIHDIVLDHREDSLEPDDGGAIRLKYPPALVLFRPDKPTTLVFEGLSSGIIPLTPSMSTFSVSGRTSTVFKIKRRQYAMTAGYAFTDYKSQGQTIEHVIIDIATPPRGSISPFSVYVALSRSRGRDTIRLLREFDTKLFQQHPSEHLKEDMERLNRLNAKTRKDLEG